MNCIQIKDLIYEYEGNDDSMPLLTHLQIWWHSLTCPGCAQHIHLLEKTRNILNEDFFPRSPELENSIMARITAEKEEEYEEGFLIPGGMSTKRWVVTGIIIMVSLVTAFFSLDFQNLASEWGMSFLLPMGITIGIILTTYSVIFIGSHLKELSERFGL